MLAQHPKVGARGAGAQGHLSTYSGLEASLGSLELDLNKKERKEKIRQQRGDSSQGIFLVVSKSLTLSRLEISTRLLGFVSFPHLLILPVLCSCLILSTEMQSLAALLLPLIRHWQGLKHRQRLTPQPAVSSFFIFVLRFIHSFCTQCSICAYAYMPGKDTRSHYR